MEHMAEKKKLLKKYLDKLTKNRVVYANGKVVRTSNLTHGLCANVEEVDLGDVKIKVSPHSYTKKIVPSSLRVRIYEDGIETLDDAILTFNEDKNKPSKFISQLTDTQIEKLIVALEPIISAIDREVSLISEEEKSSKLSQRETLIKTLEKNLKSEIKFDKLTLSELVKLTDLTNKAVK